MLSVLLALAFAEPPTAPTPAALTEAGVPEDIQALPWLGPDQLKAKKRIAPKFPRSAVDAEIPDAKCVAYVHIDTAGKAAGTWVTDCPEVFKDATKEALASWKWKPAMVNGKPRHMLTTIGMTFKIR